MTNKTDELEEIEKVLSHVPTGFDEAVKDFATEEVLLKSRYLFVKKEGKVYRGYCTHCRREEIYENTKKHGVEAQCKNCSSLCTVKSSGRGRKRLIDEGYFVYFSKSEIDPEAITARGIYVQRDYSGDFRKVETAYTVTAAYLFGDGESQMINRSYWWKESKWELRKSVFSEADGVMSLKPCYLSLESVKEAVSDTPFQYSAWEMYKTYELIRFFGLAAQYSCVEYLTKMGLKTAITRKIYGGRTYSAINWNGKTLMDVLKINKKDLFEIRNLESPIDLTTLRLFQIAKTEGVKMSVSEVQEFNNIIFGDNGFDDMQFMRRYAKLNQIRNYVKRQLLRKNKKRYHNGAQVLLAWRDYLNDCEELGMEVADENVLFPTNLHNAHQDTIGKIKSKADAALSEKIKKRIPELKKYEFKANGLFIRPIADTTELIDEGNALKHCVGRYAKGYAKGTTNLFAIRKKAEPDKPFYTLEIKNNRITQVYGLDNCQPTKEVQSFVDSFESKKIKNENREDVAV